MCRILCPSGKSRASSIITDVHGIADCGSKLAISSLTYVNCIIWVPEKNVTSNSSLVTSKSSLVTSNSSLVTSSSSLVTSNSSLTTSNSSMTTSNSSLDTSNSSLDQNDVTEDRIDVTRNEFDVPRNELDVTRDELDITRDEFDVFRDEFDVVRDEFDVTKDELDVTRDEFDVTRDDFDVTRDEFDILAIAVSGWDLEGGIYHRVRTGGDVAVCHENVWAHIISTELGEMGLEEEIFLGPAALSSIVRGGGPFGLFIVFLLDNWAPLRYRPNILLIKGRTVLIWTQHRCPQ
ncbi:hypothetical protein CRG98_011786 [Punica granatum]|uniref:Uncharacterized protein n=1 Tax=Punica granatum TaxID=22663 RepID=A0A2I0KHZ7_PUNGR|nr:hypothetical protein CRG98_011786 [Punica granatum]